MGDDACWLQRTCECGAITEGARDTCWRCGASLIEDEPIDEEGTLVATDDAAGS